MNVANAPSNKPYLAIGLTFLLLGLGFATPWPLVVSPPPGIWEGQLSREVLNLYALVTFLGCAHFFYAWQGQWRATGQMRQPSRFAYWMMVLVMLAALALIRGWIGVAIFSLAIWIYNISHLIKTEVYFASLPRGSGFYSPAAAFTWFTIALFEAGPLHNIRLVFAATFVLAAILLYLGDWKDLAADGGSRLPLLTLFLLGETLVWSAYGPYMTPAFRVGVYVFHIAAASFFHYFSSYFYAQRRSGGRWILSPGGILCVNLLIVVLGCAVVRIHALAWAAFLLAPEWFTLWVALHLLASDMLPRWKRRSQLAGPSPTAAVQGR